jgi:hypothetical protein
LAGGSSPVKDEASNWALQDICEEVVMGKPSKGTPKDRRLKRNKRKKK